MLCKPPPRFVMWRRRWSERGMKSEKTISKAVMKCTICTSGNNSFFWISSNHEEQQQKKSSKEFSAYKNSERDSKHRLFLFIWFLWAFVLDSGCFARTMIRFVLYFTLIITMVIARKWKRKENGPVCRSIRRQPVKNKLWKSAAKNPLFHFSTVEINDDWRLSFSLLVVFSHISQNRAEIKTSKWKLTRAQQLAMASEKYSLSTHVKSRALIPIWWLNLQNQQWNWNQNYFFSSLVYACDSRDCRLLSSRQIPFFVFRKNSSTIHAQYPTTIIVNAFLLRLLAAPCCNRRVNLNNGRRHTLKFIGNWWVVFPSLHAVVGPERVECRVAVGWL